MARGSSLRIEDGAGIMVRVRWGGAWLTQEADGPDHYLTAGPGFCLDRARCALLTAFRRVRRDAAEFAVVVADAWQGQGLGERLLKALLEHAGRAGVGRVAGVTHLNNRPMRALARKLGFAIARDEDPDLLRLERALAG